jgi:mitochondrial ribonuclease P protein 3
VVDHFVKKDKNVLVFGRKHMNSWPKNHMMYIKQNATLFLTENLSQDDPFLLYATLKNGPDTCFLSRDLMRSHAYLMGRELKPVFRRWQQARQYGLIYAGNDGQMKLKAPTRHQMSAQRCGNSWHIPYSNEHNANPASTFEMPASWLCAVASGE